jgi:Family of unknown function (DUF6527)
VNVEVITAEAVAERNVRFRALVPRVSRDDFERAELAVRQTALFVWWPEGEHGAFSWLCPGCARWLYGQLGAQPVSGWDAPRWVNTGTTERPTLTPSLGCGGWRRGTCPGGHYWLRDGELVPV